MVRCSYIHDPQACGVLLGTSTGIEERPDITNAWGLKGAADSPSPGCIDPRCRNINYSDRREEWRGIGFRIRFWEVQEGLEGASVGNGWLRRLRARPEVCKTLAEQ